MELLRPVALASRRSRARCTGSSARRSRSAAGAGASPRGRATSGSTFSIPITVTSTSGSVVHMRPLPSDSTTQTVPVSATAKLAPLTATGTRRNFSRRWRRAASASVASARRSASSVAAIVPREQLADLGAVAVDRRHEDVRRAVAARAGRSARPGRSRSPRCPAPASASLRPISSVASDLTLITSSAPCSRGDPRRRSRWPRRRRAPSGPCRRRASTAASSCSSCSARWRSARSLIAAPASRSSSQSGTSPTTRGALGADRRASPCPCCGAAGLSRERDSRAASGKAARCHRRSVARISARCIVAHAGPLPAQRAADVHQARVVGGRRRPRRRCRGRSAACRRASPSTCRRS